MKFRKKPIVIDAINPWVGDTADMDALYEFCGMNWGRGQAHDCGGHDEADVVVYNTKEKQWLNVLIGAWIIRGIDGELYPCEKTVFEQTYERVESQATAPTTKPLNK